MEMYTYKCSVCNFENDVPSYWVSYAPEKEMEMMHLNLETQEICPNSILKLVKK